MVGSSPIAQPSRSKAKGGMRRRAKSRCREVRMRKLSYVRLYRSGQAGLSRQWLSVIFPSSDTLLQSRGKREALLLSVSGSGAAPAVARHTCQKHAGEIYETYIIEYPTEGYRGLDTLGKNSSCPPAAPCYKRPHGESPLVFRDWHDAHVPDSLRRAYSIRDEKHRETNISGQIFFGLQPAVALQASLAAFFRVPLIVCPRLAGVLMPWRRIP
jgi:hypothetical protein